MPDAASSSDTSISVSGSCYCGRIEITVVGQPVAASICHCTTCQSLTGAPCSVQSLHPEKNVTVRDNKKEENGDDNNNVDNDDSAKNELLELKTSPQVTRVRCPDCASPVWAILHRGRKNILAIPRSMLTRPKHRTHDQAELLRTVFAPTHHMYYADRSMDVHDDGLPKYVGTSVPGRGVLWKPEDDDCGEVTDD